MKFDIARIGIDFHDCLDKKKASLELDRYTSHMIATVMRESGCNIADAKNALCRPIPGSSYLNALEDAEEEEKNPYEEELEEYRQSLPPESALFSKAADHHHGIATNSFIMGRESIAVEHWQIYKLLLCASVAGIAHGGHPSPAEIDPAQMIKRALSELGKKAADSAHAENRAMKAQALEHYAANRRSYSSKDEAAIAITKLVPVAFTTARKWLNNQ